MPEWRTRDGEVISISQMESEHLENALRCMIRLRKTYEDRLEWCIGRIEQLENELMHRLMVPEVLDDAEISEALREALTGEGSILNTVVDPDGNPDA